MSNPTDAESRILLAVQDLDSLTADRGAATARERLLSSVGFRLYRTLIATLVETPANAQIS